MRAIIWVMLLSVTAGCSSVKMHRQSISTVNEYGEVWRESISADGFVVYEYIGILEDRVTFKQTIQH